MSKIKNYLECFLIILFLSFLNKKNSQQDKGFDKELFERQMSVMRGQILNLCQAINEEKTPEQLVHMPPIVIEKRSSISIGWFNFSMLGYVEFDWNKKHITTILL